MCFSFSFLNFHELIDVHYYYFSFISLIDVYYVWLVMWHFLFEDIGGWNMHGYMCSRFCLFHNICKKSWIFHFSGGCDCVFAWVCYVWSSRWCRQKHPWCHSSSTGISRTCIFFPGWVCWYIRTYFYLNYIVIEVMISISVLSLSATLYALYNINHL